MARRSTEGDGNACARWRRGEREVEPDGSGARWAAGGSRPELGRKGEAGWAGRDFEPTKPREI
jgi:hypothetical protein